MRNIYTLIIFGIFLACISDADKDDSKSKDRELIEQMMSDRLVKFQNSTDPIEQAKYYVENITDDAIWMPQNGKRIQGKEEVKKWSEWFFSNYTLVVDPKKTVFDEPLIGVDLAVRRFTVAGYYLIKATGDSVAFDQKYEDVYRKVNGEWKISSHIWSSNNMEKSVWNPDYPSISGIK